MRRGIVPPLSSWLRCERAGPAPAQVPGQRRAGASASAGPVPEPGQCRHRHRRDATRDVSPLRVLFGFKAAVCAPRTPTMRPSQCAKPVPCNLVPFGAGGTTGAGGTLRHAKMHDERLVALADSKGVSSFQQPATARATRRKMLCFIPSESHPLLPPGRHRDQCGGPVGGRGSLYVRGGRWYVSTSG